MESLKVFVDMGAFVSGNDPRLNLVSVLYGHYRRLSGQADHLMRVEAEKVFLEAFTSVQSITCMEPHFGYPGAADNPFEVLCKNSLAFEFNDILERLFKSMLKVSGRPSIELRFDGYVPDNHKKVVEEITAVAARLPLGLNT